MHARRALLYVPGHDWRKIDKATTLNADCVCLDIEDGVAANRKQDARDTIPQALRTRNFGHSERLVRINAIGSGLEKADLDTVLPAHPDGIVIPKITSPQQIQWVGEQITAAEQANGWEANSIRLLIIVETPQAILTLPAIAQADPRLDALIFGADDLAVNIGATRTRAGWEVFYARSALVMCAAAFGLQAIDIVNVDFHDIDALKEEADFGAQLGYTGKQIIHPNQVEPVQAAFTPAAEAIAHAERVVQTYAEHQARGTGAFALDGKMVDMPILKAAEQVLARARAAGKTVSQ